MAEAFGHARMDRRWAIGALVLTSAIAVVDASFPDIVLLTFFVFGPLLAALRCGPNTTAAIGLYAIALGVVAGRWNDVFFDAEDHLTRLLLLIAGAVLAVYVARLRLSMERTRDHLVAQNALAVTLVEARALSDATPKALESIGRTLGWQLGALWKVEPDERLRLVDVWTEPGIRASGFLGLSRRTRFARGEGLPGRAWETGEPAWIENITRDDGYRRGEVAHAAGLFAALAFPVLGEDRILGVVEFYAREIKAPHPELVNLLRGFGSQLGQYIELREAEEVARASEALKTSIFETALDAVISIDAAGRVVEFNPSAERMFGYRRDDVVGREMAALIIPETLRDAHRTALTRVVEGAEPRLLGQRLELTAMRADGSEFPVELSITSIDPGTGHAGLFTGFVRDITGRKEIEHERAALLVRERESRRAAELAQSQTAFIAEVGTVLDTALDYREALEQLARIAVPRLGDWCVIDILEDDGSMARYAVAHANPERHALMEALRERYPADPEAGQGLPVTIRTGESQLIPEVTDEMLSVGQLAQDPEHQRILRQLGFRSALVVPLRARGRILGAIGLGLGDESSRRYGQDDLTYAEDLARRAALALDNSRLFTERVRAEEELRRSRDELDFILAGVADGVTAQAPDGSLIYANDAAVFTLGFNTVEELLAAPVQDIMTRFEVFDENDRPFPNERFPGRIALTGHKPDDAVMRFRVKATGEERWSVVKATPIFDGEGDVLMAINVFEDITEHKESELRARFLADAATVLASSLDYETTLQQVAELAIPSMADGCVVELGDQDGTLVPVAVAHRHPEKAALMRELDEEYPPDPRAPRGVTHVFRAGDSELYPSVDADVARTVAQDERRRELMEAIGVASLMIVPMSTGGRRLGTMAFSISEGPRRYGHADLAVAEELGRRAAVAIDNARLYRERSYIARTLQESLLPPELPEVPGAEIAARFHPAGEATEVGGDFYDMFDTTHGWGIVMGDVCGKGADAAAVTALARYTLRTLGIQESSPSEILRKLNDALLRQRTDRRFCTVAYASLNVNGSGVGNVCLSTGGHPLPYVLRADGTVEAVGEPGTLLGVLPEVRLSDTSVTLNRGDLMLLYTDGVTEARGSDGMFGNEELVAVLGSCAGLDALSVASRIESAALEIQEGNPRDDIAILAVKIR
jgi:PAS domain S-box-containing protein